MIRVVSVEAMPDEYRFNMASANSGNNRRLGMTVPLPGPLHSHKEWLHELADIGYSDIWSAESDGADGFTPLALAAAWEPRLDRKSVV